MESDILPGSPSNDHQLNVFLLGLARELTTEDLEDMKFLCSGEGGIPKGLLEKIQSPTELFRYWKDNRYLSRYNLVKLQSCLWHINRKDLFKKAATFAQSLDNTLHLFAPKLEPENGYKFIKFHVGGEPKKHTREYLEKLRSMVAQWICVPAEFVYIAGIEPSASIVVTFMVPESCLEFMTDLEEGARNILKYIHVDVMDVDGKVIPVTEDVISSESFLTNELRDLQVKNRHLTELNEDLNTQMLLLRREGELKPKTEQTFSCILPFLMNIVYELHRLQTRQGSYVSPDVVLESTRQKNARQYYKVMLTKVRKESSNVDQDLIHRLLEAHTMVMLDTFRDQQLVNIKTIDALVQDLMMKTAILSRQNEELLLRLHVIEIPVTIDVQLRELNVEIRFEFAHALAKVSQKLRPRDRAKLLKEIDWTAEEKEYLTKNYDKYLVMIFSKHLSKTGGDPVHSVQQLHQTLESIDRKDLVPKIQEYVKEYDDNVAAHAKALNKRPPQQMKLQASVGPLPKGKNRHSSGEDSTKGKNEQRTEDTSQTDKLELLLKENQRMLIALTEERKRWPSYNSLLTGHDDQPPPYSDVC